MHYRSIRHNEVRDITASLKSEVCHSVCTQPHLQPLSGERMSTSTANTDASARLDVSAYGFWGGRFERAFFNLRVFNPCAWSNRQSSQATYKPLDHFQSLDNTSHDGIMSCSYWMCVHILSHTRSSHLVCLAWWVVIPGIELYKAIGVGNAGRKLFCVSWNRHILLV